MRTYPHPPYKNGLLKGSFEFINKDELALAKTKRKKPEVKSYSFQLTRQTAQTLKVSDSLRVLFTKRDA